MKKFITILLILFVSLSTSSCMNFLERVFFNANGSGEYSFSVDMSQLRSLAELSGEEFSSEKMMSEMNMDENKMIQKLEAIEGVNNVRTEFDDENFTVTMAFDFTSIEALNTGMSTYMADSTKSEIEMFEFFSMKKKTISRTGLNRILESFEEGLNEGSEDQELDMGMMKMMFGDLHFATEIVTAKKIKSFSNQEYTRKDDNTISWILYPFKDGNDKKDMSVVIKIK
ncbi:hypothetical protein [Roseivirga sp. E12]|uniref:hypothetical protein n=1 Tax=Roseivirga sp. E12 TaxID=2819237 RepID=UPI001ABC8F98|nr:hypothetical protein [Roseivirga sp. E12]MBO3699196.1 hypothetical protein [Roseivirga sp. E12]